MGEASGDELALDLDYAPSARHQALHASFAPVTPGVRAGWAPLSRPIP